ncbi:MAG: NAD(P)H-dependent glycerol-3-phosphate dehydrogenase [Candidatus Magasanikbacteria bacterium]
MEKKNIAVLGAGNMGTAITKVLSENGNVVHLWNWNGDPTPIEQILETRENTKYLPGVLLGDSVFPMLDMEKALEHADIVFFIVPSSNVQKVVEEAKAFLQKDAILVDMSKGLNKETLEIIPDVLKRVTENKFPVVSISGPAIAKQLAEGEFTTMDISGEETSMNEVRAVFENDYLKLVPTDDMVGVELGGSFKNVYAILLGICDGLGYDLNLKSSLISKALDEMVAIGCAMGGKRETCYCLSGLGDLVGTALSPDSRNRRFGECLGKGMTKEEALNTVQQTVEGIEADEVLLALGKKFKIELPLAELVKRILDGANPEEEVKEYLKNL